MELVPYLKKLGSKRKVVLPGVTADPFKFTTFLSGDRKPCCLKTDKLATYEVSGLAAVIKQYGEPGKVALHFEVDHSGMLSLAQADTTVSVEETIKVDKMVPDDATGTTPACPRLRHPVQILVHVTTYSSSTRGVLLVMQRSFREHWLLHAVEGVVSMQHLRRMQRKLTERLQTTLQQTPPVPRK